ncbi:MAG: hypothetical protein WBA13_08415 [Microcoleaceae cyanobacterium]
MLENAKRDESLKIVAQSPSVSIILVADHKSQVVDAELTQLEAYEILWLFSQIEKYGFTAVEETLVQYLLASKNDDYIP